MKDTEPEFVETGPFQFETQCRGGAARVAGPTFKVHIRERGDWKLIMRFDCTRESPHWHEVFKGGPEKIMHWRDTEMEEAVGLATAELKACFPAKLEKLGYRREADAARDPAVAKTVAALCRKLYRYLET